MTARMSDPIPTDPVPVPDPIPRPQPIPEPPLDPDPHPIMFGLR
ncbi:proline-rich small protein YnaL [Scandinavium sp. SGZ-S8]